MRSIGVSNFTGDHLRRIIDETGVTPAVNQIELHPYFPQVEMRAVNEELGIRTESWSPLGKRQAPFAEAPVAAAAEAHGVQPGQVILRWQVQLGAVPIPKSATPSRQRENLDVFGFELTDDEMAAITGARPGGRSPLRRRPRQPTRRCSRISRAAVTWGRFSRGGATPGHRSSGRSPRGGEPGSLRDTETDPSSPPAWT